MKSIAVLLLMIFALESFAGRVREIKTDDKKMNPIYLKMGQSTVLRFNDDRPKKIVIGNQNYFNLEFVAGTKDVTIQPLGAITTNLFVYCEKNTYGFLISTKHAGSYDDLVNVSWKKPKVKLKTKAKVLVFQSQKQSYLGNVTKLGRFLRVSPLKLTKVSNSGSIIIDIEIKNISNKTIKSNTISAYASRSKRNLSNQVLVFSESKIKAGQSIKARLIVKAQRSFSFYIKYKEFILKKVIRSKHLR